MSWNIDVVSVECPDRYRGGCAYGGADHGLCEERSCPRKTRTVITMDEDKKSLSERIEEGNANANRFDNYIGDTWADEAKELEKKLAEAERVLERRTEEMRRRGRDLQETEKELRTYKRSRPEFKAWMEMVLDKPHLKNRSDYSEVDVADDVLQLRELDPENHGKGKCVSVATHELAVKLTWSNKQQYDALKEKLAEAEGRAKKASDMSQTVIDGQLVRIGELEGELQIMAGARDSLGVELRDLEEKVRELRDRLKRCQTVTENKKAQEAYHNVEFDLTEILKDTEPEGVDAKPEPPETPSTTDEPEPCEDCGGIGAHMEGCPEKKEVL